MIPKMRAYSTGAVNALKPAAASIDKHARYALAHIASAVWFTVRCVAFLSLFGALWGAAALGIAAWEVSEEIPPLEALMDGRERGFVKVLDQNGATLGVRGQRFTRLTADDVAPHLIDAILAIEDRRFNWHLGIDPIGLARAIQANRRAGRTVQGGSTLTQQVAKLAFLSRERSLTRKLREAPYALALEWKFTKREILSIYLNRVYLGAGAYGFEAAAQRYFHKSARDVSIAEATILAGLLRAPSRWAPSSDFNGARIRARTVVGAMKAYGALSAQQADETLLELETMLPIDTSDLAPHFVDWTTEQFLDLPLPEAASGNEDYILSTTLDVTTQALTEAAVAKVFEEKVKKDSTAEVAVVVLSPDGAVRAMVGGRNYAQSQFNRATMALRQVGSAFKPFVYLAALEAGVAPNAYVNDAQVSIDGWKPRNYRSRYRGWIPLREALTISSNAAAVRMFEKAGADRVLNIASRAGFGDNLEPYPSIALGALEATPLHMAGAYASFLSGGRYVEPYGVAQILSSNGADLYNRTAPDKPRIASRKHAGWITNMMRDVVEVGTGRRSKLGERPAAGKTGTTQQSRDAWFIGFTADYICAVWMGKDDNDVLRNVQGGGLPADIWRETMAALHHDKLIRRLPERRVPDSGPPPYSRPSSTVTYRGSGGGFFSDIFRGKSRRSEPESRRWITRDDRR